jgi:hypothetical protein
MQGPGLYRLQATEKPGAEAGRGGGGCGDQAAAQCPQLRIKLTTSAR